MQIARVIGSTISTLKGEKLAGRKLLIVREADEAGRSLGKPYVAVNTVDAGTGDLVPVAVGSSARRTTLARATPVEAVILAVIDSLEMSGKVTFRKE